MRNNWNGADGLGRVKDAVIRGTGQALLRVTEVVAPDSVAGLKHRALRDPLTDLPNRSLLFDRLEQAISIASRDDTFLAVLLLDLDDFKRINDEFGHPAGDAVLRETAERLRQLLRRSDTIARLGGDEFVAVLAGVDHRTASRVANKVTLALRTPFSVGTVSVALRASIGVAVFPDDGFDVDTLLARADLSMYEAKHVARRSHRGQPAPIVLHGKAPEPVTYDNRDSTCARVDP